jgi:hypothetical protein
MFRILGLIAYLDEIPIIRVDYETLAKICTNQLVGYQQPCVFSTLVSTYEEYNEKKFPLHKPFVLW